MNRSSKILIKIYMLFLTGALNAAVAVPIPGGNPQGGSYYTDEFGPTKSNYSMGDFVRYTVTPGSVTPVLNPSISQGGLNVYYKIVDIAYAQDILKYGTNTYNLYNFVGYLYAGWAALNINLDTGYVPTGNLKPNSSYSNLKAGNWLTTFRTPGLSTTPANGGSLLFDNNYYAYYTTQLVNNPNWYSTFATALDLQSSLTMDQGRYFLGARTRKYGTSDLYDNNANASCAWNTNDDDGNYVLGIEEGASNQMFPAAPYGQFFGGRISHILGAVVNDVPPATLPTGSTAITNMPTGSPVPQMAVMNGGPAAYIGASIGSTAHFGTLQRFLSSLSSTVFNNQHHFNYLTQHLLPAVTRFATGGPAAPSGSTPSTTPLCSYSISSSSTQTQNNLIAINSQTTVTAYDNGVIVDIQNNTGDQLTVKQVTSAGSNIIGTLGQGTNNYFLHTASLMSPTPAAGTPGSILPPPSSSSSTPSVQINMIEIKDAKITATNMPSVFISVVTAAQAATILAAVNTPLATASPASGTPGTPTYQAAGALTYNVGNFLNNGGSSATPSSTAQYLLVTNFNPNVAVVPVVPGLAAQYRLQALDASQFKGMPYFVTLQVSKEPVQYGYQPIGTALAGGGNAAVSSILPGIPGTAMLKCSMVSAKTCLWRNPYAQAKGANYHSAIPLLLLPQAILQSSVPGIRAHYGIWLMAYAAALTEFYFTGCSNFGDNLSCVGNTFGLFDVQSQSAPARAVIDANGYLASGQTLVLQTPSNPQSADNYLSLVGCDVWDGGMNQDIPMLYLYQNASGQIVANQHANAQTVANQPANATTTLNMINFSVTFQNTPTPTTGFAQGYGQPYKKTLLFSLPTLNPAVAAVAAVAATSTTAAVPAVPAVPATPGYLASEQGVTATLTQPTAGVYLLTFTDQNQNVLAFQKVYLSNPPTSMTINFLPTPDGKWNSPVTMPIGTMSIGQSQPFTLNYVRANGKNTLTGANQTTAKLTAILNTYVTTVNSTGGNFLGTYTMEDITNAYNAAVTALNNAIQAYPALSLQLTQQLNMINKQQQNVQNFFTQQQTAQAYMSGGTVNS